MQVRSLPPGRLLPFPGPSRACPVRRANVYGMRMARVNITVPDEVANAARALGLNVSRIASTALAAELDRIAKIASLDAYLADLEARLGPVPPQDEADAEAWADRVLGVTPDRPATRRRSA